MTCENCSCTAKMRLLSNPAAQHRASGIKLKQQKHIISFMKIISVLCSLNSFKEIPTTTINNRGGGKGKACIVWAQKLQLKVIEGRHVCHVLSMWYMSLKTTLFKITLGFLILKIENISVLITLNLYAPWKYLELCDLSVGLNVRVRSVRARTMWIMGGLTSFVHKNLAKPPFSVRY